MVVGGNGVELAGDAAAQCGGQRRIDGGAHHQDGVVTGNALHQIRILTADVKLEVVETEGACPGDDLAAEAEATARIDALFLGDLQHRQVRTEGFGQGRTEQHEKLTERAVVARSAEATEGTGG